MFKITANANINHHNFYNCDVMLYQTRKRLTEKGL